MKLQFNVRGTWRDVLALPESARESPTVLNTVVGAARWLLDSCDSNAAFRIVDGELVVLIVDKYGRKDHPYDRKPKVRA